LGRWGAAVGTTRGLRPADRARPAGLSPARGSRPHDRADLRYPGQSPGGRRPAVPRGPARADAVGPQRRGRLRSRPRESQAAPALSTATRPRRREAEDPEAYLDRFRVTVQRYFPVPAGSPAVFELLPAPLARREET